MESIYDLVIVGAGPSGLTAGLYGARASMSTVIIEKQVVGGLMATTDAVANYPGSIEDISGMALAKRMKEQAEEFGAKIVSDEIIDIEFDGDFKILKGKNQNYKAKSVILSLGSSPRLLGVPGEEKLRSRGVSYCATCDGAFFQGMDVYVIGGGDTAIEEGIYLTKFASSVTIIHRRDEFRAAKSLVEKARNNEKIIFKMDSVVDEIIGENIAEKIKVRNVKTGEIEYLGSKGQINAIGVFVFVGNIPNTQNFKDKFNCNKNGYFITDEKMVLSDKGVFASGDCRDKTLRQVVTATSDGAIAAIEAEKYIQENFR